MTRTAQITRPRAARSVRLLCVAAVVLLAGAGCTTGSGKGNSSDGAGSGLGTTGNNPHTVRGTKAPLPKGVPSPPGKKSDTSVTTSFGGTWTYTNATQLNFNGYIGSLSKANWTCALAEKNAPSFGYNCTPPKQAAKGTLHTYYLPAKKQIYVTFQNG
jgi:hypothetical protein